MPRGRMVDKSISRNESLPKVSVEAALLFTWCIPHLDCDGRMYADTMTLKANVVPYLECMTNKIIDRCKAELVREKLVLIYNEGKHMQFIGFSEHQKINKGREGHSQIPSPTPEQLQTNSGATPDELTAKLSQVKLSQVKLSKYGTEDIPAEFNTLEFLQHWELWIKYQRERKKKVTPSTCKFQLNKLSKYKSEGVDPIKVIENSIEKSYSGLYPSQENKIQTSSGQRKNQPEVKKGKYDKV